MFEAAGCDEAAKWVIRDDSHATSRVGIRTSHAIELTASVTDQLVIQEFIPATVSGVTFVRDGETLSETIAGQAGPILREGKRRTRWVADDSGHIRWISGRTLDPGLVAHLSSRLTDELQSMPLAMHDGCMLEWIISEDESKFFWVDLKELSRRYVSIFCPEQPDIYLIGREGTEAEEFENAIEKLFLPSTDIKYIEVLPHMTGRTVVCGSGSPLSHLCVAAYEGRVSMIVREGDP